MLYLYSHNVDLSQSGFYDNRFRETVKITRYKPSPRIRANVHQRCLPRFGWLSSISASSLLSVHSVSKSFPSASCKMNPIRSNASARAKYEHRDLFGTPLLSAFLRWPTMSPYLWQCVKSVLGPISRSVDTELRYQNPGGIRLTSLQQTTSHSSV